MLVCSHSGTSTIEEKKEPKVERHVITPLR